MKRLLVLTVALLLAACTYGPSFEPETNLPDTPPDSEDPVPTYYNIEQTGIYAADGVVDKEKGTFTTQMRFESLTQMRDHAIFHTDDSRYALIIDTFESGSERRTITRVTARAGGNTEGPDDRLFPEASIIIDNDGTLQNYGSSTPWYGPASMEPETWHRATMRWSGYPEGTVAIFLDGEKIGEKQYGQQYDNGIAEYSVFAIGYRPDEWKGNRGWQPNTNMSIESGGIDLQDTRIYTRALTDQEIAQLN